MLPSNVNLSALDSRLKTIFSHMSRSTRTGRSSGAQSTWNASPADSTADRKTAARSAVNASSSVDSKVASVRPASIREKSSRVLTSFSNRTALRCTAIERVPAERPIAGGERVLDGPEQQCERRAELVTDVAEERGFGAIDLGQRLGPAPFLFVRAGIGERRAQLAGHQIQKCPIELVKGPPRAERHNQAAGRRRVARLEHVNVLHQIRPRLCELCDLWPRRPAFRTAARRPDTRPPT